MKLPKPNFAAIMMAPANTPVPPEEATGDNPAYEGTFEGETQAEAEYRRQAHHTAFHREVLKPQIREIFLNCGFTIKEGETDLKPYVYDAAFALLGHLGGVMIDLEQAKKVLDSFKGEPGLVDLMHGPSHLGLGVHMVSPWDEEEKVFLGIPDGGE